MGSRFVVTTPIPDRFWPKVDVAGRCWEWRGTRNNNGYGLFQIGLGGSKRCVAAHRMAWILTNGPIPDGLHVLHHCDNPPCCNPWHLFLGDHAANMADKKAKGRGRRGSSATNITVEARTRRASRVAWPTNRPRLGS